MNKNPKVIYILISVFCVFAIVTGVYAEFFVKEEEGEKENHIIEENVVEEQPIVEKTQEELKTQLSNLFTNQFNSGNFNTATIEKIESNQDIVYTVISKEEKKENYEINIKLPAVNIKGDVTSEFNNITQTVFANKAVEILNNEVSEHTIYTTNYTAYVNEDILSVVIQSNLKIGNNPQRVIIQTYNYNLLTGEKVQLTDMLAKKNIIQSDCQKKINETVKKAQEQAEILVQSGYTVYNRDLSNEMYELSNISTCFLGPNTELYIIFAYGNNNYTSDMDIVFYE